MSIFPRQFVKGDTDVVLLHMRIDNTATTTLDGRCVFEIKSPSDVETTLVEPLTVPVESRREVYVPFEPRQFKIGKYHVNGYFEFDGKQIRSTTHDDDYFEVISESDRETLME